MDKKSYTLLREFVVEESSGQMEFYNDSIIISKEALGDGVFEFKGIIYADKSFAPAYICEFDGMLVGNTVDTIFNWVEFWHSHLEKRFA